MPKHIDKQKVIETILPSKDVDGFHPMNVGNLSSGYESSIPCTPLGCYLLNKNEMKKVYGEKKIHIFRRSWDISPAPLDKKNPYHPLNMEIYKNIPKDKIPDTESLKNTYERVIPFYLKNIEPLIQNKKNILISAHGNSIRALCKRLFNISNINISKLEIPTGNPLFIKFNENLKIDDGYYLDSSRSRDLLVKF